MAVHQRGWDFNLLDGVADLNSFTDETLSCSTWQSSFLRHKVEEIEFLSLLSEREDFASEDATGREVARTGADQWSDDDDVTRTFSESMHSARGGTFSESLHSARGGPATEEGAADRGGRGAFTDAAASQDSASGSAKPMGFLEFLPDRNRQLLDPSPQGFIAFLPEDNPLQPKPVGFMAYLPDEHRYTGPQGFFSFLPKDDVQTFQRRIDRCTSSRPPSPNPVLEASPSGSANSGGSSRSFDLAPRSASRSPIPPLTLDGRMSEPVSPCSVSPSSPRSPAVGSDEGGEDEDEGEDEKHEECGDDEEGEEEEDEEEEEGHDGNGHDVERIEGDGRQNERQRWSPLPSSQPAPELRPIGSGEVVRSTSFGMFSSNDIGQSSTRSGLSSPRYKVSSMAKPEGFLVFLEDKDLHSVVPAKEAGVGTRKAAVSDAPRSIQRTSHSIGDVNRSGLADHDRAERASRSRSNPWGDGSPLNGQSAALKGQPLRFTSSAVRVLARIPIDPPTWVRDGELLIPLSLPPPPTYAFERLSLVPTSSFDHTAFLHSDRGVELVGAPSHEEEEEEHEELCEYHEDDGLREVETRRCSADLLITGCFFLNHAHSITRHLDVLRGIAENSGLLSSDPFNVSQNYIHNVSHSHTHDALEAARIIQHNVPIRDVSSGSNHGVAVTVAGEVAIGCANGLAGPVVFGQSARPKDWMGSVSISTIDKQRVRHVACGAFHSVAATMNGRAYTWGVNERVDRGGGGGVRVGQLGHDLGTPSVMRRITSLPRGVRVVHVSCGWAHTVLVGSNGVAYSFGDNSAWQLGRKPCKTCGNDGGAIGGGSCRHPRPITVPEGVKIQSSACGDAHTLVLSHEGAVLGVGSNQHGQIGARTARRVVSRAEQIQGLANVVQVAAGSGHSMALCCNGCVYAWGRNLCGELGVVSEKPMTPVVVLGDGAREPFTATNVSGMERMSHSIGNVHVASISCGPFSSAATTTSGVVYVWGMLMGPQFVSHQWTPRVMKSLYHDHMVVTKLALGATHQMLANDIAKSRLLHVLVSSCEFRALNNMIFLASLWRALLSLGKREFVELFTPLQCRANLFLHEKTGSPHLDMSSAMFICDRAVAVQQSCIGLTGAVPSQRFSTTIRNSSHCTVAVLFENDRRSHQAMQVRVSPAWALLSPGCVQQFEVSVVWLPGAEEVFPMCNAEGFAYVRDQRGWFHERVSRIFLVACEEQLVTDRSALVTRLKSEYRREEEFVASAARHLPASLARFLGNLGHPLLDWCTHSCHGIWVCVRIGSNGKQRSADIVSVCERAVQLGGEVIVANDPLLLGFGITEGAPSETVMWGDEAAPLVSVAMYVARHFESFLNEENRDSRFTITASVGRATYTLCGGGDTRWMYTLSGPAIHRGLKRRAGRRATKVICTSRVRSLMKSRKRYSVLQAPRTSVYKKVPISSLHVLRSLVRPYAALEEEELESLAVCSIHLLGCHTMRNVDTMNYEVLHIAVVALQKSLFHHQCERYIFQNPQATVKGHVIRVYFHGDGKEKAAAGIAFEALRRMLGEQVYARATVQHASARMGRPVPEAVFVDSHSSPLCACDDAVLVIEDGVFTRCSLERSLFQKLDPEADGGPSAWALMQIDTSPGASEWLPYVVGHREACADVLEAVEQLGLGSEMERSVLWLQGGGGSGKSKVAEYCREHAIQRNVAVSYGFATERTRLVPFAAWRDVVPSLLGLPNAEFPIRMTHVVASAERFLEPSLLAILPVIANCIPVTMDGPFAKQQHPINPAGAEMCARVIRALLEKRCTDGPWLLLFEDVQWVDHMSRPLLTAVMEARYPQLLVVLTSRGDVRSLRCCNPQVISLSGMTQHERVTLMSCSLGRSSLPSAVHKELRHPAFENRQLCTAVAFLWQRKLAAVREIDEGATLESVVTNGVCPTALEPALIQALYRLDVQLKHLLYVVCLMQPNCTIEAVRQCSAEHGGGKDVQRCVERLRLEGWVQRHHGLLFCANDTIRKAVRECITRNERASLHRRMVGYLEDVEEWVSMGTSRWAAIAYHWHALYEAQPSVEHRESAQHYMQRAYNDAMVQGREKEAQAWKLLMGSI